MSTPSNLPKRKGLLKNSFWLVLVLLIIYGSAKISDVNIATFFQNFDQFGIILKKMMHPDWNYIEHIEKPLLETIRMAIIGTTIGAIFALPFAFCMARNLIKNKVLNSILRFILNIIRTIPDLLLGAIFVAIVGIGPLAGILSLAIFTFGMVAKLFYEAIETIDEGPIEAMVAAGASRLVIIRYAVLPQVIPHFFSYFLYAFEINVRASTILGYIGAGGIGVYLQRSLSQFRYDQTAIIIIVVFIVVLMIDGISNQIRERLL